MIGKTFSHYRITSQLGAGGMGVVYEAEDTKLKRTVALKFLPPELTRDPRAKARFTREAQAAAALAHPNICTIHEIDEADGQIFIAMERIEGQTLTDRLASGPVGLNEALDITSQMARGLQEAHELGIVHRDIKPSNVMVTPKGQVKIMDFGLAQSMDQTRMTQAGTIMGTFAYMSPEQARGTEIDHRTDIWSMGVILYEMTSGRRPFPGNKGASVLYAIAHRDPELLASVAPAVATTTSQAAMKALEKDPGRRFQSASDLAAALVADDPTVPLVQPPSPPISNRVRLAVMAVLVVVVGLSFAKFVHDRRTATAAGEAIAVLAFENRTGDPAFEYLEEAIPNLLITNLEQTRAFKVLTWERVQDLQRQFETTGTTGMDLRLGTELYRRGLVHAYVQGSLTRAGDVFAISVNLVDGRTGHPLAAADTRGRGVASILLRQIDELTVALAPSAGAGAADPADTLASVTTVATTSLEAYRSYLEGRNLVDRLYCSDAVEPLERAATLDSTFAPAYLYLARAYDWLHDGTRRNEALIRAMQYSDRSPERERLYIAAYHAWAIDGDVEAMGDHLRRIIDTYPDEKRARVDLARRYYRPRGRNDLAIGELEQAVRLDPQYMLAHNGLTYSYGDLGRFDEAVASARTYATLAPHEANPFDSRGDLYFKMGRLEESLADYKRAIELKPDFGSYFKIAYIHALRAEYAEARDYTDQFIASAPTGGVRAMGYMWRGFYHYWLGRPGQALADLDRAADLAQRAGSANRQAVALWMRAWILCDLGQCERGAADLELACAYFAEHPDWAGAAGNEAYRDLFAAQVRLAADQPEQAREFLGSARRQAADVDAGSAGAGLDYRLDLMDAALRRATGDLDAAESLLAAAHSPVAIKIVTKDILLDNLPLQRDLAATISLEKGEPDPAIAVYEALVDADPNGRGRLLVHPLYHYRLARLYDDKGWHGKALEHYERFLGQWADAEIGQEEIADAQRRSGSADR